MIFLTLATCCAWRSINYSELRMSSKQKSRNRKMLKQILWTLAAQFLLMGLLVAVTEPRTVTAVPRVFLPTPSPLAPDEQILAARVARSLEISRSKLSPAHKTLFVSMIADIAAKRFVRREHAEIWIALLGIESGYDGTARSSMGAVGLGQLLPKYRQDFGADCGLGDVAASDLADDLVNANLSACYFNWLIKQNHGSVDLALVSYVSGIASPDHAKAAAGKQPGPTAREYVRSIREKREKAK